MGQAGAERKSVRIPGIEAQDRERPISLDVFFEKKRERKVEEK